MSDQQGKTREDRLEVIRKLLAKAESTTHPEEAKAFSEKAEELMVRWAIEDADLEALGAQQDNKIDATKITIAANEYRGPKISLLMAVANANDIKLLMTKQFYRCTVCKERLWGTNMRNARHSGPEPHGPKPHGPEAERVIDLTLFGYATDRQFTEMLFTSLLMQREHEFEAPDIQAKMWAEWQVKDGRPNARGGWRIKWYNTFGEGYADEIAHRLYKARRLAQGNVARETSRTTDEVGIVLANRSKLVAQAFTEAFPQLGKGTGSSAGQGSSSAWRAGREAGSRANLSKPGSITRSSLPQ